MCSRNGASCATSNATACDGWSVFGRDLDGQLTSGAQAHGQLAKQPGVIGNPLQAWRFARMTSKLFSTLKRGDIAQLEPQTVPGEGDGPSQHLLRRVDPDGRARSGVRMEPGCQLSGAASQIDHVRRPEPASVIARRSKNGLARSASELRVLVRIPPLGHHDLARHRQTSRPCEHRPSSQARIGP